MTKKIFPGFYNVYQQFGRVPREAGIPVPPWHCLHVYCIGQGQAKMHGLNEKERWQENELEQEYK